MGLELDPSGMFLVQYVKFHIDDMRFPTDSFVTHWNRWILIKINVFIWRVMMDRNLIKHDIEVESLLCLVCSDGVEDVSYLFSKFSLDHQLWLWIMSWMDL